MCAASRGASLFRFPARPSDRTLANPVHPARSDLANTLERLVKEAQHGGAPQYGFPELDTGKVQRIIDETLGFV